MFCSLFQLSGVYVWLRKLATVNPFLIKEHISKYPKRNAGNPNVTKACAISQVNSLDMIIHCRDIQRIFTPIISYYQTCQLVQELCKRMSVYSSITHSNHEEKQMRYSTYEWKAQVFWTPPLTCCWDSRDSRDLDFCQGKCSLMWNKIHQRLFSLAHIRKW